MSEKEDVKERQARAVGESLRALGIIHERHFVRVEYHITVTDPHSIDSELSQGNSIRK